MDAASPDKRLEIARWLYARALGAVRAESNAATWATLLRAAQNLRYATAAARNAAAAGTERGHHPLPRPGE